MTYYVKIEADKVIQILGSDWTKNNNHLEKKQGAKVLRHPVADFQSIIFNQSLKSRAGSLDNYIVESGVARLMTDAEYDNSHTKPAKKSECDQLYKQLRRSFAVQETEVYEFDLDALLLFDTQVKNKTSDIKVKEKGSKIKALTKTKADAISNKINLYFESLSDAYNADWDLIESGTDYTLPNLTAIKEAQEVLKS